MIRFASPEYLKFLRVLPLMLLALWYLQRRAHRRFVLLLGAKVTPVLTASLSSAKRQTKIVLFVMAVALFLLALARPQLGKSLQEVKLEGVELMLLVDVSTSMLAEDVKPSRLEHAKSELIKLMDILGGDKVGLIAFAESAVLVSPLTTDKASLKMFIEGLSPESVENQGTNVTRALAEAKEAFEGGGTGAEEKSRVTRVILLLSDGEDHESTAIDSAKKLANDGMRIFSLAFGTEKGAPIPLRDERGFLRGYKRERAGSEVISRVHGDFLRELAATGKGSFHQATFGGREATMIKDDLDRLQKSEFASSLQTNFDERYQYPLGLGIFLLLLSLLIPERKAESPLWRGRFEVAK